MKMQENQPIPEAGSIASEELKNMEVLYRTMVMKTSSGIAVLQGGKLVFVNPYLTDIYGYREEDFLDRPMLEFIHPEDRDEVRKNAIQMLNGQSTTPYRYRVVCADGKIRCVLETVTPISYRGNPAVLGNIIDITELVQLREQLQNAHALLLQEEKLYAIGTLAGGIAHEILNPLNIISMNIQMMEMGAWPSEKIKEMLAVSARQVQRIERIVRDLSTFAKPSKGEFVPHDINKLMESVFALISPKLRLSGIDIEKQYEADLPNIPVDQSKMWQVIINLFSNAIDAMDGRSEKRMLVTTALEKTPEGDFVRIVFSDSGKGIDEENISRIFDPFFTTKDPGMGTGLGLSISFGILQEHRGTLHAENNKWGGASFVIRLPVQPT
jgi:PAS domain S-box-containing protein